MAGISLRVALINRARNVCLRSPNPLAPGNPALSSRWGTIIATRKRDRARMDTLLARSPCSCRPGAMAIEVSKHPVRTGNAGTAPDRGAPHAPRAAGAFPGPTALVNEVYFRLWARGTRLARQAALLRHRGARHARLLIDHARGRPPAQMVPIAGMDDWLRATGGPKLEQVIASTGYCARLSRSIPTGAPLWT